MAWKINVSQKKNLSFSGAKATITKRLHKKKEEEKKTAVTFTP